MPRLEISESYSSATRQTAQPTRQTDRQTDRRKDRKRNRETLHRSDRTWMALVSAQVRSNEAIQTVTTDRFKVLRNAARAHDGQYITGLVISAIPMPQLAYISAQLCSSPRFHSHTRHPGNTLETLAFIDSPAIANTYCYTLTNTTHTTTQPGRQPASTPVQISPAPPFHN